MRSHSSNVDLTTARRSGRSQAGEWEANIEAPTFLPKDEVIELVSRSASRSATTNVPVHQRPTQRDDVRDARDDRAPRAREAAPRVKSDSVVTSAPRPERAPVKVRTEPASRPAPLPEPPSTPRKKHHHKEDKKAHRASSSSATKTPSSPFSEQPREHAQPAARGSQPSQPQQQAPQAQPARGSQPSQPQMQAPAPQSQPQMRPSAAELPGGGAPFVQFPNGGASFDPLAIPLPPELASAVYGWLRRLALQADLAGADRLLRDALAELTSSLSVIIIYAGPDGFYTLGADDEVPKETGPIIAVGKARRALSSTHTALVPIVTSGETIAVIQLSRNARQPAFGPPDYIAMAAFGREATSVMHHLVVEHLQRRTELARDKGSLYRPEALDHHRKRGTEGVVADLSPRWVRRAYPMIVISILAAVAFAFFIKVPTYSTGKGVVQFDGTRINAPAAGNVALVMHHVGDGVAKGEPIAKLSAATEEADLRRAETEDQIAIASYLVDPTDDQVRKSLAAAHASRRRAQESVDQRTVRAPRAGRLTELHAAEGQALQFGEEIGVISDEDALPYVRAYMPGNDISQLLKKQFVTDGQINIKGYTKKREHGKITQIAPSAISSTEVRKQLGTAYESAIGAGQDGVMFAEVRIELPHPWFKYHDEQMQYRAGMQCEVEIKLDEKRFLVQLLPDLSHIGAD
ncbi:MAG TPA: HlyD family efflux transporter periplasmic adaptor subunit [Kofleriaceae bacterium]|jgi:biotin carboxyl carrier protein|nr:HlyD family efflux transporter periplasmic adaptor subunit [Kofleriaceae bacterium]